MQKIVRKLFSLETRKKKEDSLLKQSKKQGITKVGRTDSSAFIIHNNLRKVKKGGVSYVFYK